MLRCSGEERLEAEEEKGVEGAAEVEAMVGLVEMVALRDCAEKEGPTVR